jgi:hypothetical protein
MGAAALAAVSVVFQDRDPGYSQELLDTAQSLYLQVRGTELDAGWYFSTVWQ